MAWTVTRTVKVRLDVPDDRESDLHVTDKKFRYCANRTADWAWRYPDEDCVTSKSEAEAAIYDDLREETDCLRANLVRKAIECVTDDVGNCVDRLTDGEKTSQPEYDTLASSTTSEPPRTTATKRVSPPSTVELTASAACPTILRERRRVSTC